MHGDATALSREVVRDLLYQGFQARFLEGGAGLSADAPFRVDVRAVVMARGMQHSSDGKGDLCSPGHLSPGPMLAFGATPLEFLRQLGRKGTAPAAARSGGRSWTDLRRGLVGWDGPPGMMTQVLAGASLAFAQRGQDRAALVFEELAATETGGWHEGMNFAAAQSAPLVVVLDLSRRADDGGAGTVDVIARGYGVAAAEVSEEPYPQLFRTVAAARRRAVQGRGPTLIAMLPRGAGDPWALHDAFVAWVLEEAGVSETEVRAIERAASTGVDHAFNRLAREPGVEPLDALVPVCAHEVPQPPWTRRATPNPGWRVAAEPQEVPDAR